jgi:hypothetical protein
MNSVVNRRPVDELLGTLIDINAFGISSLFHLGDEGYEEGNNMSESFERNPKSNTYTNNSSNYYNGVIQAEIIPESLDNGNSNSALPSQYFQYNTSNAQHGTEDQYYINPIPSAPVIVNFDDESPTEQARAVASKARFGSDMGRIQAMEEKERIKRISANAKALPYFESQRVAAAGTVAKQRVRQGFEVKKDNYFDASNLLAAKKEREANNKDSSTKAKNSGQGYQIAEYETAEYDCNAYETTEYKSVYD